MVAYLNSIWEYRFFLWNLVQIDWQTRYRGAILGFGWSILQPLILTGLLCFVFHKVFGQSIQSYAPYVLAGMTTWNYLTASTMFGAGCFFQAEPFIRQYPVPAALYPLRTTIGATFNWLIAMGLTLILSITFNGVGSLAGYLSLLPTAVLLFLLCWSLGTLAGFVNTAFQDTSHLLEVVFQILFYATPIMYQRDLLQRIDHGSFLLYNPVLLFLDLVREPLVYGRPPELATFLAAAGVVLITACAAILILVKCQRRLVFLL